jgi:hypothetical protein
MCPRREVHHARTSSQCRSPLCVTVNMADFNSFDTIEDSAVTSGIIAYCGNDKMAF